MAANPVESSEPARPVPQPNVLDQIKDLNRRLSILEKQGALTDRVAALEEEVFGP